MRAGLLLILLSTGLCCAEPVTLVSLTNSWRYNQTGTNLGTAWIAPDYDDSDWPAGRGVFAYETDTESVWRLTNTVLRIYDYNLPPIITYYFRTHFQVTTPVGGSLRMTFSNLVDDGALVYLNGQELYRLNLPLGTVDANTPAPYAIPSHEEGIFIVTNISAIYLQPGDNVLAVEVHQANITSSDVHFGLGLTYDPDIIGDAVNPEITSAEMGFSRTQVRVQFSDRLDPVTASRATNYTIHTGDGVPLRVLSAVVTNFNQVILTTEPRQDGPRYVLSATGVQGEGGSFTVVVRKRTIGYQIQWDTIGGFGEPPFLTWKYDQSGMEAPPGWQARDFDDRHWPSGAGAFAFEDNPGLQGYIATQLTRWAGPCCSTQIVTYYFRAAITNVGAARSLDIGAYLDDGALFYWNGQEIARVRMPAGPIGYGTFATQAVEAAFTRLIIPLPTIHAGANVIAAEVHQVEAINNDVFFGAWVTGIVPSERVLPTLRYRRSSTQLIVDWDDPEFELETALRITGPWTPQLPRPQPITLDLTGPRLFLRLASWR